MMNNRGSGYGVLTQEQIIQFPFYKNGKLPKHLETKMSFLKLKMTKEKEISLKYLLKSI